MSGKKAIVTKGKGKGQIGYYKGSEVVNGMEMVTLEMDWSYQVNFPKDSIEFLAENVDSNK